MADSNRRSFLKSSALGAATLSAASYARTQGANERFVVAVIGPGGMGSNHIRNLVAQPDVDIAYVCDPDQTRLAAAARLATREGGKPPETTTDMRRLLDNRDIIAVFIATPDHWHAPATLLAVDAGKHVYVEKPCSHNIREGRLMIEAARRNRKVVQVGTQSRSTECVKAGIQAILEGAIGECLAVRVWNSQLRRSIGKQQPTDPPATLDYDTWTGPAPKLPYQANRLHGVWRWCYNYGTGDMGNDGVHDLDVARWGLGVDTHPSTITALGGKYFFDDDQQFPDTQTVVFEWPAVGPNGRKKQMIFEQRIWTPYRMEGYENGEAYYGTQGMLVMGHSDGWKLYGPRNRELRAMEGKPDIRAHHRNFFECIRSGNRPTADIEIGHLSSSLCHLGNIATRLGRVLHFNPQTEEVQNDAEANAMVRREYRDHWGRPRGA
jgi:predicted dehydrogenase